MDPLKFFHVSMDSKSGDVGPPTHDALHNAESIQAQNSDSPFPLTWLWARPERVRVHSQAMWCEGQIPPATRTRYATCPVEL